MKMRNSDIAKFGTGAKQITELRQYAQSLPLPYGKTTDEEIAQNCKELKKKYRADIKIRHLQADKASGFSSANSNISKTMSSRKLKNPQTGASRSYTSSATPNTSAASLIASPSAASSIASSIAIQRPKRERGTVEHRNIMFSRARYALLVTLRQYLHRNSKDLTTL